MGRVLLSCAECQGTEDFVLHHGVLCCLCSVESAGAIPLPVEHPPRNYVLIADEELDASAGLGKPFRG